MQEMDMDTTRDEVPQRMDSDEYLSPPSKHKKIISFGSRLPTCSASSSADIHGRVEGSQALGGSVCTAPPRNLRKAIRATRAEPQDVESIQTGTQRNALRLRHILEIFTCSSRDDFTEVSAEQVERVKQMHERIEEGAEFSFNYNVLLLVSSVIAGFGLVSNSLTSIIASMLVSPLMGPVVGLAYGTTIRDMKLVKKSFRVEIISLVACILIGAVVAACTGPTALSDDWPTQEMASRGTKQNFLVALPIAFFSGLGVAVSLLDEQTASLVGVAISASLLPPAVNSGCLWVAYGFYNGGIITPSDYGYDDDVGIQLSKENFRQMGVISLAVTLSNIVLIWISSMLMFRMKEVLPIKKRVFWDDLRVARQIYTHRALLRSHTASSIANNLSPISDTNLPEED